MLWRDDSICKRIFLHKFRVSFVDMQGFPVSVSCPLQMDPDLWNCLKRLRLVNGVAAHGCLAPGLRGSTVNKPGNNPRFRSVPATKERNVVGPQRNVRGRGKGNGNKGVGVSRASSAPAATTRQSEAHKVPHPGGEARGQPKNKRPRLVSPKRSTGGSGGSKGGPPGRTVASQGPWKEPAPRPSTIKPVGLQPTRQQQQPQKQQQQQPQKQQQQPKQHSNSHHPKPHHPKQHQPKPQQLRPQLRPQQGQHPKELQQKLRPPPRIPGQNAAGKASGGHRVASTGSNVQHTVSSSPAAADRPPRPSSQGPSKPIGARGLKIRGSAAGGVRPPPAEQKDKKRKPGSLVQQLLKKVQHTPRKT